MGVFLQARHVCRVGDSQPPKTCALWALAIIPLSITGLFLGHTPIVNNASCDILLHLREGFDGRAEHRDAAGRAAAVRLASRWEIFEEFIDSGVSGCKESRPALDKLFTAAKRRKFSAVLVYRYDRFARSLRQLVNALCEFDALGIHFVSLHEGVDTSTPNGRLVFGIFASIAEFERELIRSRVRSGLAAARAKGRKLGRPKRIVDARRIAVLRAQGRSWREITVETGIAKGTAQRAFSSLPKIV